MPARPAVRIYRQISESSERKYKLISGHLNEWSESW